MSADKTVGGRTRTGWNSLLRDWMGLTPDLVALLDAAFSSDAHSRGIRDGLERAAKLEAAAREVHRFTRSMDLIINPDCEDFRRGEIVTAVRELSEALDAIRAEASKLDGDQVSSPPHCPDCPDCPPEPPTEERRDAHAFVVGPVPDYCHFTAGGGRCNQSRAWHEPAEERKLLGHTFDQVGDLGYATELDICQRPIRHPAGDQVCGQPCSAHEPTR